MAEVDNRKTGSISEGDLSILLNRYSAKTLVSLLQEVAQCASEKIDWDALVKKTSTGISSAREYQNVWRHLAYGSTLLDKGEDDTKPLEDDSDLEYEIEASPSVTLEESVEAAAYAKLLIASGLPNDPNVHSSSTIEAPLIISVPKESSSNNLSGNSESSCLMQRRNIAITVSVQKQTALFAASVEGLDASVLANGGLSGRRKRRKPWSDAEDMELVAAVRKCGEGNWTNILRSDFKGNRTASQLYQRWSIIRRKHGGSSSSKDTSNVPQLTEAQLAARRAMSMALGMPIHNPTGRGRLVAKSGHSAPASMDLSSGGVSASQPRSQSQNPPETGAPCSTLKSRVAPRKMPPKSYSPDSMVKAAAVAAGARIVTQDDATAASALRSANAVHIMGPAGSSLIKSSLPGGLNSGNPNVHFIRTGIGSAPSSQLGTARSSANVQFCALSNRLDGVVNGRLGEREHHGDTRRIEDAHENVDEDGCKESGSGCFNGSDNCEHRSCERSEKSEESSATHGA